MRTLWIATPMLLLAACASIPELTWRCEGGATFKLHYDKRGQAVVSADDHIYVLPPAPAASGARYSDGIVEYWEHQDEATLTGTMEGPFRQCRRTSAPAKPAAG